VSGSTDRLLAGVQLQGPGDAPWLQPLRDWPRIAVHMLQRQPAVARIVMASVQGSAPREAGVCMLVSVDSIHGTVGGGQLEWQALTLARAMLAGDAVAARTHRIVLGGDLGQCCGGVVELWIERYTQADSELLRQAQHAMQGAAVLMISTLSANSLQRRLVCDVGSHVSADSMLRAPRENVRPRLTRSPGHIELIERLDDAMMPLWLYGAGHVGQALARIVLQLPLRLTWIDSRAELFPTQVPDTVQLVHSTEPVSTVAAAPAGVCYAIMTHSHALDYALCRSILTRGDFAWAGLIGSHSKAARFRSRLARHGLTAERIGSLVCPIGVRGIDSKWPAAIAVSIAAQLLQHVSAPAPQRDVSACGTGDCDSCHANGPTTQ
jgi:xanthine dehydrogenase accessory factor